MKNITFNNYYTYDDVLIKPKFSNVLSRKNVCLKTKLTKNITLNTPIISSNMDTITEDSMAIEIAKIGGIGIIHRYCTIDKQIEMVKKVKRYTNYIIHQPYTINEKLLMEELIFKMKEKKIKSFLVENEENELVGIITNRDLLFYNSVVKTNEKEDIIKEFMTPFDKLITINKNDLLTFDINDIINIMTKNKIQRLPITDNKNKIIEGLITLKDMLNRTSNDFKTKANLDNNSQLRVGAAVGVNKDYLERTSRLISEGCDIICLDVAHGHHSLCGDAIKKIKVLYPNIDIIAGNVCTGEGVKYLVDCGASCVKVGIGPGSICITRKQTGCGAPQLSSVIECAKVANELGITIIADGGHNGTIGNIFKALCCGASACMLGGFLSGTLETPGNVYTKLDKKVKHIRGMAGIFANFDKSEKMGEDTKDIESMTPEGVEGYVPFKGPVKDIIHQIEGGIKSGLSYVGCGSLEKLKDTDINFVLITANGYRESGSHNIHEI
uniref:CBS domain-containing protein n=1 Tax=viral metagenome TaxID=1070528 RepID=A0A6C0JAU2_9ZZZZ